MTKSRMEYFTIANFEARFTHKHDLDRITKSKNDEKEEEVEVETSHLERRSSTRQGRKLSSTQIASHGIS